jgi:hypothetical protein
MLKKSSKEIMIGIAKKKKSTTPSEIKSRLS